MALKGDFIQVRFTDCWQSMEGGVRRLLKEIQKYKGSGDWKGNGYNVTITVTMHKENRSIAKLYKETMCYDCPYKPDLGTIEPEEGVD